MPLNIPSTDSLSTETLTSRPSSADSHQADEQPDFEQRLSMLNEEEMKSTSHNQTILWDDPYDLLIINEQTGRIGLSVNTHRSSSASQCKSISSLFSKKKRTAKRWIHI